MLTIHHLGVSQSERILWLCEELGLPYALDKHDRDPVTRLAPAGYKALHPSGTAPVITDGDVVLGETGAIVEYILNRYGEGRLAVAPDRPDYPDYLYWLHFANGSMMPAGMVEMIVKLLDPTGGGFAAALRARADNAFAMVEARLGEVPWFAGADFTAADIMMLFPLTTMRYFCARDLEPYPNLRAYLARVGERPAYRAAMAKGDPEMTPLLE